jgi:ferredoxin
VEFHEADVEREEYDRWQPDLVTAHLCASDAIVERAGRALAPGRCLAMVAFHVDQWKETGKVSRFAYDEARIDRALRLHGFVPEVVEVEREVARFASVEAGLAAAAGRGQVAGGRTLVPVHRVSRRGRPHPDARASHRQGPPVVTLASVTLTESVKARALDLGFDRVTVGPVSAPEHGAALRRWLDAGYAGTMGYLERRLGERLEPARVLPGVRSVVCVALNYYQGEPAPDPSWEPVARYAWGRDYHDVMTPRLEALGAQLAEACGAASKGYVDTGPVLERDLAARAGLGWVGKNTMLLHPDLGSWFLIGVLLTTAALDFDEPLPDRCGTCRACLDACPTGAFVAP